MSTVGSYSQNSKGRSRKAGRLLQLKDPFDDTFSGNSGGQTKNYRMSCRFVCNDGTIRSESLKTRRKGVDYGFRRASGLFSDADLILSGQPICYHQRRAEQTPQRHFDDAQTPLLAVNCVLLFPVGVFKSKLFFGLSLSREYASFKVNLAHGQGITQYARKKHIGHFWFDSTEKTSKFGAGTQMRKQSTAIVVDASHGRSILTYRFDSSSMSLCGLGLWQAFGLIRNYFRI